MDANFNDESAPVRGAESDTSKQPRRKSTGHGPFLLAFASLALFCALGVWWWFAKRELPARRPTKPAEPVAESRGGIDNSEHEQKPPADPIAQAVEEIPRSPAKDPALADGRPSVRSVGSPRQHLRNQLPNCDTLARERAFSEAQRVVDNPALLAALQELLTDYWNWTEARKDQSAPRTHAPLTSKTIAEINASLKTEPLETFFADRDKHLHAVSKALDQLIQSAINKSDEETIVELTKVVGAGGTTLPAALGEIVLPAVQGSEKAGPITDADAASNLDALLGVLVLNELEIHNPVAGPLMTRIQELAPAVPSKAEMYHTVSHDTESLTEKVFDRLTADLAATEKEKLRKVMNVRLRGSLPKLNLEVFAKKVRQECLKENGRLQGALPRIVGRIAYNSLAARASGASELKTVTPVPLLDELSYSFLRAKLQIDARWKEMARAVLRAIQAQDGKKPFTPFTALEGLRAQWGDYLESISPEQHQQIVAEIELPDAKKAIDWGRELEEFRSFVQRQSLKYTAGREVPKQPDGDEGPKKTESAALFRLPENQKSIVDALRGAYDESQKVKKPTWVLSDTRSGGDTTDLDKVADGLALGIFWNEFVWRAGLKLKQYPSEGENPVLENLPWRRELTEFIANAAGRDRIKIDDPLAFCRAVSKEESSRLMRGALASASLPFGPFNLVPRRESIHANDDRSVSFEAEPVITDTAVLPNEPPGEPANEPLQAQPANELPPAQPDVPQTPPRKMLETHTVRSGLLLGMTLKEWIPEADAEPARFLLSPKVHIRAEQVCDLLRSQLPSPPPPNTLQGLELLRRGDWSIPDRLQRPTEGFIGVPIEIALLNGATASGPLLRAELSLVPDATARAWGVVSYLVVAPDAENPTARIKLDGSESLLARLAVEFERQLSNETVSDSIVRNFRKSCLVPFPDDAQLKARVQDQHAAIKFEYEKIAYAVPVDVLGSGELTITESALLSGPFARRLAVTAFAKTTKSDVWRSAIRSALVAWQNGEWQIRAIVSREALGGAVGDLDTGWLSLTAEGIAANANAATVIQSKWNCSTRLTDVKQNGISLEVSTPLLSDRPVGAMFVKSSSDGKRLVADITPNRNALAIINRIVRATVPKLVARLDPDSGSPPHRLLPADWLSAEAALSAQSGLVLPQVQIPGASGGDVRLISDHSGLAFEDVRAIVPHVQHVLAADSPGAEQVGGLTVAKFMLPGTQHLLTVNIAPNGSPLGDSDWPADGQLELARPSDATNRSYPVKVWLTDWSVGEDDDLIIADPASLRFEFGADVRQDDVVRTLDGFGLIPAIQVDKLHYESGAWSVDLNWAHPLSDRRFAMKCRLAPGQPWMPEILRSLADEINRLELSTGEFSATCSAAYNHAAERLELDAVATLTELSPLSLRISGGMFAKLSTPEGNRYAWTAPEIIELTADGDAALRDMLQQRVGDSGLPDLVVRMIAAAARGSSEGNGGDQPVVTAHASSEGGWSLRVGRPDVVPADKNDWRSWAVAGSIKFVAPKDSRTSALLAEEKIDLDIPYRLTRHGLTLETRQLVDRLQDHWQKRLTEHAASAARKSMEGVDEKLRIWLSAAFANTSLAALGDPATGIINSLEQASSLLSRSPFKIGPLELRVLRVTGFRPYLWEGNRKGEVDIHFAPFAEQSRAEFGRVADKYYIEFDVTIGLPGGPRIAMQGEPANFLPNDKCRPLDELVKCGDEEIRVYISDPEQQPNDDYLRELRKRFPTGEVGALVERMLTDRHPEDRRPDGDISMHDGSRERLLGATARRGAFRMDWKGLHRRRGATVSAADRAETDAVRWMRALSEADDRLVELLASTGLPFEPVLALATDTGVRAQAWSDLSLDDLALDIDVFVDRKRLTKLLTGKDISEDRRLKVFSARVTQQSVTPQFHFDETTLPELLAPLLAERPATWQGCSLRLTKLTKAVDGWEASGEIVDFHQKLSALLGLPSTEGSLPIRSIGFGPRGLDFSRASIDAGPLQPLLVRIVNEKIVAALGLGSMPVSIIREPVLRDGVIAFGLTGPLTVFDRTVQWRVEDVRIDFRQGGPKFKLAGVDCGLDDLAGQLARAVAANLASVLGPAPLTLRYGAIAITLSGTWCDEASRKFGVHGTLQVDDWLSPTVWRVGFTDGRVSLSDIRLDQTAVDQVVERVRRELLGDVKSPLRALPLGEIEFVWQPGAVQNWRQPRFAVFVKRRDGQPIKVLGQVLPWESGSTQTKVCDVFLDLVQRSVNVGFDPRIKGLLEKAVLDQVPGEWRRIEVGFFGERVELVPEPVNGKVTAVIRARLDNNLLTPPGDAPAEQIVVISALEVSGDPLAPHVSFQNADVRNAEILVTWLTKKLRVGDFVSIRRLEVRRGKMVLGASLRLPGLPEAAVDDLVIPLDGSSETLFTTLGNALLARLPMQSIPFGNGQQITLSPPHLTTGAPLGFTCEVRLRVLESPIRVEVPGVIALKGGNLAFQFDSKQVKGILFQAVGQVLGPVLQDLASSAGGIEVKNFNVQSDGQGIPIGFQTGGALKLDMLGADFADLSLEFDRCVVTARKVVPPRVWKLVVPVTIFVPPAIDIYQPGGQYDAESKVLELGAKVAITRQEGTSNLLYFQNAIRIPLEKPLRLSTQGKLFIFKVFAFGEVRGELDLERGSVVVDFETNPSIKNILQLKGHIALYCALARFEGDLSVSVLGCNVARARLLLDFKNMEFQVAGHVDLFIVKVEAAFTIDRGFRNPRLFTRASIKLLSLDLVWLELDVNARRVRTKAGVAFVHVTLTFPQPWAINSRMIEEQLLNLLNPVRWMEALFYLFTGNLNISFGSPPGPGGDGPGGGSNGNESGGEGGNEGKGGGSGDKKESLLPPGATPLDIAHVEGGDYLVQFYQREGQRRLRLRRIKEPQTEVDLRADFGQMAGSQEITSVEASISQGQIYIRSFGIHGGTDETPACMANFRCTGVAGSSDQEPMIVRWKADSKSETDIGRAVAEAWIEKLHERARTGPPQPPSAVPDRYTPVDPNRFKENPMPPSPGSNIAEPVGDVPVSLMSVDNGATVNQVFYVEGSLGHRELLVLPCFKDKQFKYLCSLVSPGARAGAAFDLLHKVVIVRKASPDQELRQGVFVFDITYNREVRQGTNIRDEFCNPIKVTFVPLENFELEDEDKRNTLLPARAESVARLHSWLVFRALAMPNPWVVEYKTAKPRTSSEGHYLTDRATPWPIFNSDTPSLLHIVETANRDGSKTPVGVLLSEDRVTEWLDGQRKYIASITSGENSSTFVRSRYPFWLFDKLGGIEAPLSGELEDAPAEIRTSLLDENTIRRHPLFYRQLWGTVALPLSRITENKGRASGLFRMRAADSMSITRLSENAQHAGPEDLDSKHIDRKDYPLRASAGEFFATKFLAKEHELFEAEIGNRLLLGVWKYGTRQFAEHSPASLWLLAEDGSAADSGFPLFRFDRADAPLCKRFASGSELKEHRQLLEAFADQVEKETQPLEPLRLSTTEDGRWEVLVLQKQGGEEHLLRFKEQKDKVEVGAGYIIPPSVSALLRQHPEQVELHPLDGEAVFALVALIDRDKGELTTAGEPGDALSLWLVSQRAGVTPDILGTPWSRDRSVLRTQLFDPDTLKKDPTLVLELHRLRQSLPGRLALLENPKVVPWWFTCYPDPDQPGHLAHVERSGQPKAAPTYHSRHVQAPSALKAALEKHASEVVLDDLSEQQTGEAVFTCYLHGTDSVRPDTGEPRFPLWILTENHGFRLPFLSTLSDGATLPRNEPCRVALDPQFWKPADRRLSLFEASNSGEGVYLVSADDKDPPSCILMTADQRRLWLLRLAASDSRPEPVECPDALARFLKQSAKANAAVAFASTHGKVVLWLDHRKVNSAIQDFLNASNRKADYPLWVFRPADDSAGVAVFRSEYALQKPVLKRNGEPPVVLTGEIIDAPDVLENLLDPPGSVWSYVYECCPHPGIWSFVLVTNGDQASPDLLVYESISPGVPRLRRVKLHTESPLPIRLNFAQFLDTLKPNANLGYDNPLASRFWSDLKRGSERECLCLFPKDAGYLIGPAPGNDRLASTFLWRLLDDGTVRRQKDTGLRILQGFREKPQAPLGDLSDDEQLMKVLEYAISEAPNWLAGRRGRWDLEPWQLLSDDDVSP